MAWARIVDHVALRAAVTAWRKGSELWRALALARWRRTLQLFRSSILPFHRQKRPSGNSLAGQGLGTSVLWTIVHRGAPCQRIVLYAAAVQPGWSRMKQWWHRWPTSFFRGGNHPSFPCLIKNQAADCGCCSVSRTLLRTVSNELSCFCSTPPSIQIIFSSLGSSSKSIP